MNRDRNSLTEGPIWKKMLMFALPIFFGNVFQQLYNAVDALIVGQFLNKQALAAVTSTGSLVFMLVGFFSGIATGAGVIISRYYGANDENGLRRAVHTDIAFGIVAGIVLSVLGATFAPTILRWMGTPENVMAHSVSYIRVYFCGAVFVVMYNICVGILQAVGDSKHPLYYLIVSSIINVILDLLFIGVFKWGVWSAACATAIAQCVSVVLCLYRLTHCDGPYRLEIKRIRFHWPTLKNVVSLGLPAGMQNSVIAFANIIVQSNINAFQDAAMAGCGAYSKVEGFAFLPITCFSMALSTFVGQNLGAKQYDRVKKGVKFGILCSIIMAEIIGVCIFFFGDFFVGLFNSEPDVVAYGARQAKIEALAYFLLAFSHCIAGIMRGAGKATVPMFTMLFSWCVVRITYITVMIHYFQRIEVVFTAYPLTWFISSVIFLIYFFKADWIHNFDRLEARAHDGHHHHHHHHHGFHLHKHKIK